MIKEVMQIALDALDNVYTTSNDLFHRNACDVLLKALAQPEPEPVGRFAKFSDGIWKEVTDGSAGQPLYAAPQKKEWVGLTDEKSQPEEKYYKQAVDGEIPEAYTPAKGGLLPEQKPEPFGIWHQGDTSEECDFFLYADAGDVACDACVALYTEPQRKEWVGLTDEEMTECYRHYEGFTVFESYIFEAVVREVHATLKEKNA